jgi:hypothetical protein
MFDARRSGITWRRSHIRHNSSLRLRGVKSKEGLQVFRVWGDDAAVGRQVSLLRRMELVSAGCCLVCSIAPMQRRAQQQVLFAPSPAQHAAGFITILSGMLCMHVMVG